MKNSIESLHNYGICLESRTITFFKEICPEHMEEFIKNVHILDNHKEGVINIKLSSEGGCVSSGFAMYDAIKSCRNYVRIYGYSEIASMATVVFQAADSRILLPNSYFLLHEGEQTISGHPKSNESWIDLYKDFGNRMYSVYLERINEKRILKKKKKLRINELVKLIDHDVIFLSDKIVSLGLADEIITF